MCPLHSPSMSQFNTEGSIRILPTGFQFIQYWHGEYWHNLCGKTLKSPQTLATVACRQLGYSNQGMRKIDRHLLSNLHKYLMQLAGEPLRLVTLLDDILSIDHSGVKLENLCNGTENSVAECTTFVAVESPCASVVGIICQPGETITAILYPLIIVINTGTYNNFSIRLAGGNKRNECRVEVQVNGHWGTVCNSKQEGIAGAICSKLGFDAMGNLAALSNILFL